MENPGGFMKSVMTTAHNVMATRKIRAFIRSNGLWSRKDVPEVNLMSADEDSDSFWQPKLQRSWRKVTRAHYVNETVFVHGLYSPFHFSHWLYNGMIPLYSTMKRFGGTKDSWTFRASRFYYDPLAAWALGRWITFSKLARSSCSPKTSCLPRLKLFLSRTPLFVSRGPLLVWARKRHVKNAQDSINKRLQYQEQTHKSRQDKNEAMRRQDAAGNKAGNSQLQCQDRARYYNFESAGPNHGSENGEAKSRFGQMYPNVIEPAEIYQNLFVEDKEGEAVKESKRKRLVNDEELIQGLVQAGFRVKWITFDHGCGIAETAYLLRDVNVLITPHENAIRTSVFMPNREPVPTVISVDNSRYKEGWFKHTTSAIRQRFIQTICGPTNYADETSREHCPYLKDLKGAWDILNLWPHPRSDGL
ncbi:hypothetical protein BGZ96_011079 [Linnemannia gamsii]|uniref:Glycosyltransferase family 61 protein n=1 Tax=Linnemannia gamsii TaxID=64522 RepID=A0ABQ7JT17_9FUNG|nr:hypothetical protein BGZ96_011079 [Linnemannia gamsii]